eukprot:CAMPEP_0119014398 /NCGR_PEP_ID=MMETSP1176-20130426/9663_1 /TAXON_ID=265551 /ORGANISM="Synedropsis recta cf, Strain CCMP1620" /LENGTH=300 /DNA_ID=CAMNT_0006967569 /DNA_START=52 /DNA_END=954 /DNA_ORIENTATION=-
MGGLTALKRKTVAFKRKVAEKTYTLRWKHYGSRIEEEATSTAEELPLLKNVNKKAKTQAWGGVETKDMAHFAATSAVIASTFSGETKSTVASDLYRAQRSPKEERIEYPVVHKRDIFIRTEAEPQLMSDHHTKKFIGIEPKPSLAAYSISGSMLCGNIENGRIKEDSTKGARKMTSPQKPTGLPKTAVAASALFRSMQFDDVPAAETRRFTGPTERKKALHQNIYGSMSDDSIDDEDSPYVTIKRSDSKDDAQTSVSSVTMYSNYQNDPMVRASTNLLDILRSNKFENFTEETSQSLYEA